MMRRRYLISLTFQFWIRFNSRTNDQPATSVITLRSYFYIFIISDHIVFLHYLGEKKGLLLKQWQNECRTIVLYKHCLNYKQWYFRFFSLTWLFTHQVFNNLTIKLGRCNSWQPRSTMVGRDYNQSDSKCLSWNLDIWIWWKPDKTPDVGCKGLDVQG